MEGNGAYVWVAFGITLVVVIWNIWSAKTGLKRNLRMAAESRAPDEAPRRPTVTRHGQE